MIDNSCKCDNCEKEMIIDSGYPHNYGLVLSCRDFGIRTGGDVFAVMQYPPIDREHHFCGKGCLGEWLSKGDQ